MKRCVLSTAALAAQWAMVFVCALATAQTRIDMYSQAKNIDFSRATSTRPFPVGSDLPAVCAAGETYFKSDAPAGRNLYLCTATNLWTPIESGGTTGGDDTTYTGHHDFSGAASLTVRVLADKPPAAECDSSAEAGGVVLRKSTDPSKASVLYLCQSTGNAAEWKISTYAYGTQRPTQCDAGELFFDTDAPAGQQWTGCVATDTWISLGGGGAGIPMHVSDAGKLLGTDGSTSSWRSLKGFMDDGTKFIPDGNVVGELAGNNLWSGHQAYPASATQTISGAASRIVCNRHTVAISAPNPVTLSSIATVEDGSDGQVCVIVNTGLESVVLQDQDRLAASNLQLAAPAVTIAPKTSLRLMFNAMTGNWIQEGIVPRGTVRGMKCGAGGTGTPGATVAETLAAYTFGGDEAQAGDLIRLTALWQHLPGANGTLDTLFRTQLGFGGASLEETVMLAASDASLFSEYWIYFSGSTTQTVIQRHFRTANNSFLPTQAVASLTAGLTEAAVYFQARPSSAGGSDDTVTLASYCVELVKGNNNGF